MSAARPARGFTLVSAIFLITVLASLAAFVVAVSGVQHATSALDVLGARAYYAARAGIEWGRYRLVNAGADCAGVDASSFLLGEGALTGFQVTVSCRQSDHQVGATTVQHYTLTSRATQGAFGSPDFVARQVQVKLVVGAP